VGFNVVLDPMTTVETFEISSFLKPAICIKKLNRLNFHEQIHVEIN